jgi:exonuclease SbcC
MQLLKLEVRNWVHHRQRTCEFTRGLVAILGENGSGKSSLFGAIRWALTGENPNFGVKADNVSQYARPGEPSHVALEFEHNGHIARVTRHLLPEKEPSLLVVDGTEAGRGDKAVTAGIEKLLGVDAKFISRFIIVSQTEIFSFIDDNQAETDKFFQRLFNTARADKCQDVIGKALAKLTRPEILKPASQLTLELNAADAGVHELHKKIKQLPSFEEFLSAQRADQELLRQWDEREKIAAALVRLSQQDKEYAKQLADIETDSKQQESDLEALVNVTGGQESAHAAARSALGHWESYKSVVKSKESLQGRRQYIADARAKDPAPEKPGVVTADELAKDINVRDTRIQELSRFVRMFDENGVAECPTCHTPSAQLAEQVAQCNAELIPLRTENAELSRAWGLQLDLEKAWKLWESREQERFTAEQKIEAAAHELTVVKPPELGEDELRKTVDEYAEFQRVKAELEPVVRAARENRAKLAGLLAGVREQHGQLSEELRDLKVTSADAHLARTRLEQLRQRAAERQQLEQHLTQAQFAVNTLIEQRELAQRQENLIVKTDAWTDVAGRAREVLKNAPRLVAQRNLARLESAINELLQIFGVNFAVKTAEDGSPNFVAEFYDGRKQPAQRLSIGQKTVLALAFRVAVNAMFAEEIGLLALDEPTASLDSARIRALAPVLEKLRDLSTAKGLQCLLVTHASNLSHLFESVIELEAPELRHVAAAT